MNDPFELREATLAIYRADKDAIPLWRGEVIDKRSGASICRTARVPSRNRAMLDGATHALDRGYLLALDDVAREKNPHSGTYTAFSRGLAGAIKTGTAFAVSAIEAAAVRVWNKFQR